MWSEGATFIDLGEKIITAIKAPASQTNIGDYLMSKKIAYHKLCKMDNNGKNMLLAIKGTWVYYLLIENAECPGHSCASPEREDNHIQKGKKNKN